MEDPWLTGKVVPTGVPVVPVLVPRETLLTVGLFDWLDILLCLLVCCCRGLVAVLIGIDWVNSGSILGAVALSECDWAE